MQRMTGLGFLLCGMALVFESMEHRSRREAAISDSSCGETARTKLKKIRPFSGHGCELPEFGSNKMKTVVEERHLMTRASSTSALTEGQALSIATDA
jgi:hypothetical protein